MKSVTRTKSRKSYTLWRDITRNKELFLIAVPVLMYYIIFCYIPMYGALIAFKDYTPMLGVMGSPFVGLKHFINLFQSPDFGKIMGNTLTISLCTLVFGFPAPIILALLLNELQVLKIKKLVQNVTYLPHFISLVVICGMIKTFTAENGVITSMLTRFGVDNSAMLLNPRYFVPIYVVSGIWQEIGWSSIIYIAALTNVDASLIEAASVDGAGHWKKFIHITIPSIMPTVIIMLILKIGGIVNVGYEKIILLYNDSVMDVADVINSYSYRMGILNRSWSFSSAVGLFNSVVSFLLLIITNTISKRVSENSLW